MDEKKFKQVRSFLFVAAAIHFISSIRAAFISYQITQFPEAANFALEPSVMASLGFSLVYPILFLIGTVKALQGLQESNPYYWILAISLAGFSVFSWAMPVGVIVLLVLLSRGVREEFLQKLDL